MKHSYALTMSILLLLLTACSSETLFRADFDSDPEGGLPNASPPGEPAGDSIWIATLDEGPGPPHAVSVIEDGAISGHSLRYANIDIPSLVREIRFYSIDLPDRRPKYWATWVGRLDDASDATSPLQVHFGSFTIGYATFRFHQGQLWVRRTPELGSEYEPVGDVVPAEEHTVIVTVDDDAGTFSIALFQPRGQTLHVGPRPLGSRSVLAERRLDIQLRFDGEGHSEASYVIDGVTILQREPEMP